MDIPKHYRLHSEDESHFTIHDERDGSKFKIAKKELHPAHQIKVMKMQKLNEGTDDVEPGEDGADEGVVAKAPESGAPEALKVEAEGPSDSVDLSVPTSVSGSPQTNDQAGATGTWDNAPQPQAQVQPQASPNYPTNKELEGITGEKIAGIKAEATAQEKQNTLMAKQYQKNLVDEQNYADAQAGKLAEYEKQYNNLTNDVTAAKIDPDRYWHDKKTGAKIGATLGIMLGGLSAGLTRGENPALQMLNKHIENDIEAQRLNIGNKQSLLSHNLAAQGNLTAATNATRLQMNAMAQGKLLKLAAETGNPIIAARAQQNAAELMKGTIPLRMQLSNNEIQMQLRGDVLRRLSAQGHAGAQPVDMQDLSRAGLVDKTVAEKEGAAIQKRQQAEAYVMDQVKKLDQEQRIWGNNLVPNLLNPNSYDRRNQYRAGVIQAIQSASASKRLNPEMLAIEAEPFLTKTLDTDKTREEGLNGLIGLIRSHADPTPMASHFNIPGALNSGKGNLTRKSFELGPVK